MQQAARIIPLTDGEAVTGVLTLIEDVTERVVHEAELRVRARRQSALASASRAALSGREIDEIAQEAAGLARDTLAVEWVELLELLPDGNGWARLAGTGWPKPSRVVFASSLAAQLCRPPDASPIQCADVQADVRFADETRLLEAGVRGAVLVPIRTRGSHPFGVLAGYSRRRREFTTDEVDFARSLADVLSLAVDRKRLEAELRARVAELADTDRRKDEFLAMLAHELRNPLAPIRNGLLILRHDRIEAKVADGTRDMIDRQVQHLSRLVDDLLDVSRITRGKIELRLEPVDLAEVLGRGIETARPLIESKHHRLNVSHQGGAMRVMADPTRLTQVFGNLLNNAAKYTDPGGEISVSLRGEGPSALVEVRDSGVGMAPRMLPRVFELFTQADATLDRAQGGLGIGLTLVKTLVEMHGGRVGALSEGIGKGSTFRVHLPLSHEDQTANQPAGSAGSPGRRFRILVVDDNADSAESLAMVLSLAGHETRTAHSGVAGLKVAREFRPEVILLDIGLPSMDGYEVAREIRASYGAQPVTVIAMTGYGSEEDRRKSREAGFDIHLVKPLDLDSLRRTLQERVGI
jgi:signal transduction histidine kinase/CheY-like chemotaxis protein